MHADSRSVVRAIVQHPTPPQRIHYVAASDEGSNWKTTSQRFSQGHNIGLESVILLAAAGRDAESGDGLVEYEEDAVLPSQLLHSFQVAFGGRNHAHICHYAFGDDRGNLSGMMVESLFE